MPNMKTPKIKTSKNVIPTIYAYTTPGITYNEGWTKIGYTEQDVEVRIDQQTHTAHIKWNLEWKGNAVYEGTTETFTDNDFHRYLQKEGVERMPNEDNEWFKISGADSKLKFYEFRENHGITSTKEIVASYKLRTEQERAVSMTLDYAKTHKNGEFLWNAKPRFGKTLSTYDFIKQSKKEKILIVTNRPAIANSWFHDYSKFLGSESGFLFVSEVDALKGKAGVLSRKEYNIKCKKDGELKIIEFVSLQDMKGSVYFGGQFNKLKEVAQMDWDILVIDEAHEGVDTYKTDVAFDQIKRDFTLHLSGTPFKALATAKFPDDAIFNWTYADEQEAKHSWDETSEQENPYAVLPQLNMFTYQMSEIIREELKQGIEINGETEEYAFDLNEFFATNNGKFVYDSSVDKFLDALTLQKKFPFSTLELRDELKHTFWLLNRVESAKALAKKLENHPVFKDYKIVLAAGDGKIDDDEETKKSYDKVKDAIANSEKTITLSVGQLTTGITIPEWTAVLMLSNVKSPALYMQAAFRAQNPWLYHDGSTFKRKENAYVFDFDPARTLTIYEEFANDLSKKTSGGRGDTETRKENIRKLLNFFPVIGEDENGELTELDAEKVLTIPRKIRSVEVVKRGFMSNFLFQNISQVFGAPKAIMEIIEKFEPVAEQKNQPRLSEEVKRELSLDENGNVSLSDEYVIGKSAELFGEKIYENVEYEINEHFGEISIAGPAPDSIPNLQKKIETITKNQIQNIIQTAKENYMEMKKSDQSQVEATLSKKADSIVEKSFANFNIKQNVIEQQRTEALQSRFESGKSPEEINKEFDEKKKDSFSSFQTELVQALTDFAKESENTTVETVETNIKEREKNTIEDGIRDHLRGFSRTIPSFLMAYGDETVTLATFDSVIPDDVFLEVTSITLDQFKFLRDGGKYKDDDGNEQQFIGHLFDEVVFDDSVKEFLLLKKKLADYFDEKSIEDIFDYIPPQKTNQIFTPKDIVKKMVDMLEKENPGCFDMPEKTFIDLYMKSGLYIAEIVKRLYQSETLKKQFPDKTARLKHIFEKQVYGLAPTEIIYKIATSFILGFDENVEITKHNFRQVDALPYAKDGTLQQKLDELFGE